MYKIIQRMTFNNVSETINKYRNQFMKELEYNLWMKYILLDENFKVIENKKNLSFINLYLEQEFKDIKLFSTDLFYHIPSEIVISLLDEILSSRIEDYLVVPLEYDMENDNEATDPEYLKKKFLEYFETKNPSHNISDLYVNYTNKDTPITEDQFCSTPKYFNLLQLRSILLYGIKERMISIKRVNQGFNEIQRLFNVSIQKHILYEAEITLNLLPLEKIFDWFSHTIELEVIQVLNDHSFENTQNFFEDTKKKKINSPVYAKFIKNNEKSFKYIFEISDRKKAIEKWAKDYISEFTQILSDFFDLRETEIAKIKENKIFDNLEYSLCLQFCVYLDEIDFLDYPKNEFPFLRDIYGIKTILSKAFNDFKQNNYSVAFLVKGIYAENSFSRANIKDIDFFSGPLYQDYQMKFYNKPDMLVEISESILVDHVWIVVHNIKAYHSDITFAATTAKAKALDCLSTLYYFISKDKENFFEIDNKRIQLFDHTSKNTIILNGLETKIEKSNPKSIDDIHFSIYEFLNNLYTKHESVQVNVLKAARHYHNYCNSSDINDKFIELSNMLRSLFSEFNDDKNIIVLSSIVVAGQNYNKSDISYKKMRSLLQSDFEEFFRLSYEVENEPLKERVLERFKVFCRMIFKDFLNYNIFLESIDSVSMRDIAEWKLMIYPDHTLIGEKKYEK